MSLDRIELLRQALIDLGLAGPDEFLGCSEAEIDELQQHWDRDLPTTYRRFLAVMGREAGEFLVGTDVFLPYLRSMQEGAEEILAEAPTPLQLPADAVVFAMHQGYQFWFFRTSEGEDPPVYYYMELKDSWRTVADHLTEFLLTLAQNQADMKATRDRFREEHGLDRRPHDRRS